MYQFSLQVMHNPLKFTGMGLFYFGNELLRKVYLFIYYVFICLCNFCIMYTFRIINHKNSENCFYIYLHSEQKMITILILFLKLVHIIEN